MASRQATRSVVAAAEGNLGPVVALRCVVQRLMQKSSNVAKDVNAMVVLLVGTKCAYKFVMESLK
jgi:coenzyme F420-reducing hydrogenase beta subunit